MTGSFCSSLEQKYGGFFPVLEEKIFLLLYSSLCLVYFFTTKEDIFLFCCCHVLSSVIKHFYSLNAYRPFWLKNSSLNCLSFNCTVML